MTRKVVSDDKEKELNKLLEGTYSKTVTKEILRLYSE
jgi:hypothetical protein